MKIKDRIICCINETIAGLIMFFSLIDDDRIKKSLMYLAVSLAVLSAGIYDRLDNGTVFFLTPFIIVFAFLVAAVNFDNIMKVAKNPKNIRKKK